MPRTDEEKCVETPGRETPDEKTSESKTSVEVLETLKPVKNFLKFPCQEQTSYHLSKAELLCVFVVSIYSVSIYRVYL